MDCPVCKNPMITLELDQIEVDICSDCDGIWLDKGELELLLQGSQHADSLLNSFVIDKTSKEKPRKCPICSKKMQKINVGQTPAVLIDKCPRNDGIWFDQGELDQILTKAKLDENSKIRKLLTDMFGKEINTEKGEKQWEQD